MPQYCLGYPDEENNSLFSRINAWIHLWPSIVSGIVLVLVCLTGTIIVYGDEIMDFSAGSARYVSVPPHARRVTHEQLVASIHKANPDMAISEFVFFKDPERSIRIRAFIPKERKLVLVYVNPYNGKVLKVDKSIFFFFVMAHIHSSFLAGKIGGWVVAVSTVVFVISCITGLILWWPRKWTRATRQASFTVKWKERFKRLNYDLHNVFGFYSLVICLILGLTGLMIFFKPMMNAAIKISGGTTEHLDAILPKADSSRISQDAVAIAYVALANHPEKKMVSIWNFEKQKAGALVFTSGKSGLKSIENADINIYNRYTGKEIHVPQEFLRHEKTENIVWQLHMGQWWGQFGKLATFLSGIVATTLPVTGFLIWWGRRKKSKKPA